MRLHEVATFKTTKTTKVGKSAKDGAPAAGKEGLAFKIQCSKCKESIQEYRNSMIISSKFEVGCPILGDSYFLIE